MSDILEPDEEPVEQLQNAVDEAFEAGRQLKELEPENELLRFIVRADEEEVWAAFQKRFGKENSTKEELESEAGQVYVWARYCAVLKGAIEGHINPKKHSAD